MIVPACHDTASATAAIPATGDDWAFISSGTWSLVGTRARCSLRLGRGAFAELHESRRGSVARFAS